MPDRTCIAPQIQAHKHPDWDPAQSALASSIGMSAEMSSAKREGVRINFCDGPLLQIGDWKMDTGSQVAAELLAWLAVESCGHEGHGFRMPTEQRRVAATMNVLNSERDGELKDSRRALRAKLDAYRPGFGKEFLRWDKGFDVLTLDSTTDSIDIVELTECLTRSDELLASGQPGAAAEKAAEVVTQLEQAYPHGARKPWLVHHGEAMDKMRDRARELRLGALTRVVQDGVNENDHPKRDVAREAARQLQQSGHLHLIKRSWLQLAETLDDLEVRWRALVRLKLDSHDQLDLNRIRDNRRRELSPPPPEEAPDHGCGTPPQEVSALGEGPETHGSSRRRVYAGIVVSVLTAGLVVAIAKQSGETPSGGQANIGGGGPDTRAMLRYQNPLPRVGQPHGQGLPPGSPANPTRRPSITGHRPPSASAASQMSAPFLT